LFVGAEEQINIGVMLELMLAAKIEVVFPTKGEANLTSFSCSITDQDAKVNEVEAQVTKTKAALQTFATGLTNCRGHLGDTARALNINVG
jgi:hypothetical protein